MLRRRLVRVELLKSPKARQSKTCIPENCDQQTAVDACTLVVGSCIYAGSLNSFDGCQLLSNAVMLLVGAIGRGIGVNPSTSAHHLLLVRFLSYEQDECSIHREMITRLRDELTSLSGHLQNFPQTLSNRRVLQTRDNPSLVNLKVKAIDSFLETTEGLKLMT